MLVFSAESLVFLAVPKTGTTALEHALRSRADITFSKQRKHITAQRFHNQIAPFLKRAFALEPERMAVMRDPEDQIRSWYKYRSRERLQDKDAATDTLSFDDFVRDVIRDDPPAHAQIGSQFRFLTSARKQLLVHHLFAYEDQPQILRFLETRFGEPVTLQRKNVSPPAEAPLDPDLRSRLRAARPEEFALYDRLRDAGGHLVSDLA
ncbi:MAG: sulfotransferase family 2 domain-containing protein [Pseudodonghicola sp.]|nr:sulfotransferase family 2 domain-containing protein [Pseudodonghicola sp.]